MATGATSNVVIVLNILDTEAHLGRADIRVCQPKPRIKILPYGGSGSYNAGTAENA